MRNFTMLQAGFCLPGVPGFQEYKTYAAWPVWSDSTTKEIRFQPMPKKAAVKLFHRARDFDRQTKAKDKHGGALGHTALQVLHTLLFDFLNYTSGRLDPSYAAIARKANVCQRTVATALAKLRDLGVLNWVRRCAEGRQEDGRFMLQQETNAYAVLPETQWRGYRPLPDVMSQAVAERQQGGSLRQVIGILDSDPTDTLAAALARLGQAMQASTR